MSVARVGHRAVLLNDGRVLVRGGESGIPSAEVYDQTLSSWSSAGSVVSGTADSITATLLPDGRVLVAGSGATSELYQPVTNSWSATGALTVARAGHAAVLLSDGRVLVAGGEGLQTPAGWTSLTSAEIYDPVSGLWSPASTMITPRGSFGDTALAATALSDGTVLVVGGLNFQADLGINSLLASSEVYDPVVDSWLDGGSMLFARGSHTATLLRDGRVLVAGGRGPQSLASPEYLASGEPSAGCGIQQPHARA